MKEATGELNMTVITVVAIAAIAAFFYVFVWPGIKVSIAKNNCEAECGKGNFNAPSKEAVVAGTYSCTCSTSR